MSQHRYIGRIGLFELLILNTKIRHMVQEKRSSEEIQDRSCQGGMLTLRDEGIQKALAGLTTLAEVIRVTIE